MVYVYRKQIFTDGISGNNRKCNLLPTQQHQHHLIEVLIYICICKYICIYVYILKLTYRTIGLAQTCRPCGRNQNGNERHQVQVRQRATESANRDFRYRILISFFCNIWIWFFIYHIAYHACIKL